MSEDVLALDDIDIKGIEEHPESESVLLHGPPGTGKTTTAAARVGLLIRDHGYSIGDVAWATYRRSLAEDTLERLAAWNLVDDDLLICRRLMRAPDSTRNQTLILGNRPPPGSPPSRSKPSVTLDLPT